MFDRVFKRIMRGVQFEPRNFVTMDARLEAYDYSFLLLTGQEGSTGLQPNMMLMSAVTPTDFDYHVTPPQIASQAPVAANNPLITPALALSFAQNLAGH